MQGSTPFGARPESSRVGSVVERAIAKVGGRTRTARVRPAAELVEPVARQPDIAQPTSARDLKQPLIEIESRLLARDCLLG